LKNSEEVVAQEGMEGTEVVVEDMEDMEVLLVMDGDGLIGVQDMSGIKILVTQVQIVIQDTVINSVFVNMRCIDIISFQ